MKNKTETTAITTRGGALLWKRVNAGPRGGAETLYQSRNSTDVEPSSWRLWCSTQREAAEFQPVGTGAGI